MKLRSKSADIAIFVTDPQTNQTWQIEPRQHLTSRQLGKMASRPDMILYYVHFLRDELEAIGLAKPVITVDAWASLNGREVDEAEVRRVLEEEFRSVLGFVRARSRRLPAILTKRSRHGYTPLKKGVNFGLPAE